MATAIFNRHEESIIRVAMEKQLINARLVLRQIASIDSLVLANTLIKQLVNKRVLSLQREGMYSMTTFFKQKIQQAQKSPASGVTKTSFEAPVVISTNKTPSTANKQPVKTPKEIEKAKADAIKKHNKDLVAKSRETAAEKIKAEKAKAKADAIAAKQAEKDAKRKAKADAVEKAKAEKAKVKADAVAAKQAEKDAAKEAKRKAKADAAAAKQAEKDAAKEAKQKAKADAAEKARAEKAKAKADIVAAKEVAKEAEQKAKADAAEKARAEKAKLEAKEKAENKAKREAQNEAKKIADAKAKVELEKKANEAKKNAKRKSFSKTECMQIASTFSTKTEWNLGNRTAYDTAKKNSWFDDCVARLGTNLPKAQAEPEVATKAKTEAPKEVRAEVKVKAKINSKPAVEKGISESPAPEAPVALDSIRKLSKILRANAARPEIERLDVKRDALEVLAGVMPNEIADVLYDIANDLK